MYPDIHPVVRQRNPDTRSMQGPFLCQPDLIPGRCPALRRTGRSGMIVVHPSGFEFISRILQRQKLVHIPTLVPQTPFETCQVTVFHWLCRVHEVLPHALLPCPGSRAFEVNSLPGSTVIDAGTPCLHAHRSRTSATICPVHPDRSFINTDLRLH